ncbi:ferric reductase like transmembrane component [Nitzschia inconspicua]|uniref:Ferric reductase like transmembrane component n=1 Tax=Nitzschia inconspicua TaxID=303405 RepID=A0A9K3LN74_9STRA|nr:ferric reductase like transmembrane component [Nitzschia inconspicua]
MAISSALSKRNVHLRLSLYWIVVVSALWILFFFFTQGTEKGRSLWNTTFKEALIPSIPITGNNAARILAFGPPILFSSTLCYIFMTSTALPVQRISWIVNLANSFRKFQQLPAATEGRQLAVKNQFLVGESNFDHIAVCLIVIPCVVWFLGTMGREINTAEDLTIEGTVNFVASAAGVVGGYAMSLFLIPVSRHSILLVAMGWSPVNALRLHIWAGYTSFFFLAIHTILYVFKWFLYYDEPVWDQIKPNSTCWGWNQPNSMTLTEHRVSCRRNWYNLTGILIAVLFLVLLATSLNWFRRQWYRVFYLFHVFTGTLIILISMLHWGGFVIAMAPSIAYYLASTAPTLIQALASRFRGGVRITRVVQIPDAGGCIEVHMETNAQSQAALERKPCLYCKICIPSLSIVWHPFTVFMQPQDLSCVRFLFRPVGPFTKAAAEALTSTTKSPVTIVDGFYSGEDRVQESLQHDHVCIVAGGVAITPFLSMIPSILAEVAVRRGGSGGCCSDIPLKKLVLHWVCREEGLIRYILETYIRPNLALARELGFDLTMEVHYTGSKDIATYGALLQMTDTKDNGDITSEAELMDGWAKTAFNKPGSFEDTAHGESESEVSSSEARLKKKYDAELRCDDKVTPESWTEGQRYTPEGQESKASNGHVMEVGRMMSDCNDASWRDNNVPLLLTAGCILWMSYILVVRWYSVRVPSQNQFYTRVWGVLLAIVTSIVASIVLECIMILVVRRKDRPASREATGSSFPVTRAFQTIPEFGMTTTTTTTMTTMMMMVGGDVLLAQASPVKWHRGRPAPSFVVADSKNHTAPAMFLCGPVPLMDAVRKECTSEDKVGLTRICLYEERFEM